MNLYSIAFVLKIQLLTDDGVFLFSNEVAIVLGQVCV